MVTNNSWGTDQTKEQTPSSIQEVVDTVHRILALRLHPAPARICQVFAGDEGVDDDQRERIE